jgi:hypothetical protein
MVGKCCSNSTTNSLLTKVKRSRTETKRDPAGVAQEDAGALGVEAIRATPANSDEA